MENLGWGLEMTVLGMGLVFSLLALLWLLLTLVLKLDKEEAEKPHASEAAAPESVEAPAAPAGKTFDGPMELAAAIAVAVAKFRAQRMPAELAAAITIAAIEHRKAIGHAVAQVSVKYWPGTQPSRWTAAGRARARQTNNWNPWGR